MGAFVLMRRGRFAEDTRRAKTSKSLQSQGFLQSYELETEFWTVVTYRKLCGQASPIFKQDEDNFLTYTGTLLHRKLTGAAALESIFKGFDGKSLPSADLFGAFCLILCHQGRLFLLPDRLGVYKVYHDEGDTIVSSSFLAVLEGIERPRASSQSIYEYVIQGATYDDRTVIDQILLLPPRSLFTVGERIHRHDQQNILWQGPRWTDVRSHLALIVDALREPVAAMISTFGDNIETALSAGYDSRLLLALLRDRHCAPRVHVYGRKDDVDVVIAKAITAGTGFSITHVDKSQYQLPPPTWVFLHRCEQFHGP